MFPGGLGRLDLENPNNDIEGDAAGAAAATAA
jgi:hypothetical protein